MFTLIFSFLNAAQQTTQTVTGYNMPSAVKALSQFLPFILIIAIFYFFLIRPQNKQRQALSNMIDNLNKNDKIITKGGVIAKIDQIKENSFIVELYDGTKMEILKHAVISIINENSK
ncbi:MAG: preprotein translocase subunit YajC [bacterium]